MGTLERAAEAAAAARKISRRLSLREHKMPETTVPVSLRDAFLEDPFFRTGWDEMNSECKEMRSFTSKEGDNSLSMDRGWPWLPKQWMLPQLLKDSDFHLPEMKDSLMMGLQEEKDKMEVTLDTSGYKPDELKVEIKDGELCVEGKHEERSQTGEVMVSRHFSRRFGMPQNVKKEGIVSNLSQDGVMVITMPKEQRIEEVERGNTPIQVDHVRSSSERKTTTEEASAKLKREEISNQGRVDNFEGAGEMQRRRRSLSKAGRSRDTSRARETTNTNTVDTAKENKESKTNTRGSSRGREMVVERREERRERGRSRARDLQVPMTLRQPFLEDDFFKGTLARLENTREDFFKQARESFEESMKQMESRMSNSLSLNNQGMNDSFFPKDWIMNPPSSLNKNFGSMLDKKRDCSTIKHNEDDNKVEVHLDTSGYKPDELKVQVEGGIVRVEGKHEEKSEAGAVMVSRQFVKEYALPESSKPEGVESSLSKDGVLVITMPKPRKAINQDKSRSVPIAIK